MMNKIQATALFTGFLLVFGAVGGMDNPDQADMFFHQLAAAFVGLFMMFMAVFTANLEGSSDE
jgi:glycerol uptake facilitator-like aquaporin